MATRIPWGEAPQQEYTQRRLCPGPVGSDVGPHISRWWRYVDPGRRDGWHCCACDWEIPEISPVDGTPTAEPARGLARTVTPRPLKLAA